MLYMVDVFRNKPRNRGSDCADLDEKAVDTLLLEGRLDRDVNDKTSRLVVYG
jgi:hypothetical protein